jgi:hypothetical protein
MPALFHVTSELNRESIRTHGLDWSRMGAAHGIAGSPTRNQMAHAKDRSGSIAVQNAVSSYGHGTIEPGRPSAGRDHLRDVAVDLRLAPNPAAAKTGCYATRTR